MLIREYASINRDELLDLCGSNPIPSPNKVMRLLCALRDTNSCLKYSEANLRVLIDFFADTPFQVFCIEVDAVSALASDEELDLLMGVRLHSDFERSWSDS